MSPIVCPLARNLWSPRRSMLFMTATCLVMLVLVSLSDAVELSDPNAGNTTTKPNSCTPSNCVATCSPGCAPDQVCVLGTMSECGKCPSSSCMSRSLFGSSSSSSAALPGKYQQTPGSSNNNGPLVGGLVGGLLGAGLVVSAAGYAGFRYKQKKRYTLPFIFQGKPASSSSVIIDEQSGRQQAMSGVIPVAYIPPSHDIVQQEELPAMQRLSTIQQQQQQYDNVVASSFPAFNRLSTVRNSLQRQPNENPFSDSHRPNNNNNNNGTRFHVMTQHQEDDEDDLSQRISLASSIALPRPAQTTATQVMRAKPTIMRVNTVRSLSRSGSARTILTRESSGAQLSRSNTISTNGNSETGGDDQRSSTAGIILDDNPFDDRYAHGKTTDSVMSGPGDGEITIFWGRP